jgi:hypothetical protein
MAKKPRGAPSKLNSETKEKIRKAILLGATYALAANYAGVSYDSFNNWMKKGESSNSGEFTIFSTL